MTATTPALELRPYQSDAIARTLEHAERGQRAQLGVAATGLGKTVMFVALAQQVTATAGGRVLVLAHRDELIAQAARSVLEWWPDADVGVVKAERNEVHAQVVVASVQTLARRQRLDALVAATGPGELLGAGPFSLVVVDEAHHAAAETYQTIIAELNAGKPSGPLLLGVTATPDRGDGEGLDDVFSSMPWAYDLLWGIRSGYLADVRGKRVHLDGLNLADVKLSRGDYQAGDAGRALEDAGAPEAIVASWLELASDRARTLVFTPTVATAEATAAAFNAAGIPAGIVSGQTPTDERRELLQAYHRGDLRVLANCMVLTEGYDEPATDCIVMARPTKSRALYTQCVGRGTRLFPGKADVLVLDVVGASDDHSLVTIPSLFGLDDPDARDWEQRAAEGEPITEVLDDWDQHQVQLGRLRAEDAELFKRMRAGSGVAWVQLHAPGAAALYVRSLGKLRNSSGTEANVTVVLQQHEAGSDRWSAWVQAQGMPSPARFLVRDTGPEHAQGVADDYARRYGRQLADAAAPWRKRAPSAKAVALARKLKLDVDPAWSAGDLSDRIDSTMARRRVRPLALELLEPEPTAEQLAVMAERQAAGLAP